MTRDHRAVDHRRIGRPARRPLGHLLDRRRIRLQQPRHRHVLQLASLARLQAEFGRAAATCSARASAGVVSRRMAPLSMMARWNSPLAPGIAISVGDLAATARLPEDRDQIRDRRRSDRCCRAPTAAPRRCRAGRRRPRARTRSRAPRRAYVKPKTLRRWLMVTTTTSPVRARLVPSSDRPEPDPVEKPPPCSHTMTGRLRPSPSAGVNTFSTRQSSLSAGPSGRDGAPHGLRRGGSPGQGVARAGPRGRLGRRHEPIACRPSCRRRECP